ncbi:hypothetical protein MBLNU459_g0607t1 [Dothideomycetes sp. NU459]
MEQQLLHSWHDMAGPADFGEPAGIPHNPDDWEDWLRWDPTADSTDPTAPADPVSPVSPDSTTKTSNNSPMQDLGFQADHFPPLGGDETLAPPLIVGDDASMADFSFDQSVAAAAFSFGDVKSDALAPFVFGADAASSDLQPIVNHLRSTDMTAHSPSLWPSNAPLHDHGPMLSPYTLPSNDYPASIAAASAPASVATQPSPASTSQPRTSMSSLSPVPEQRAAAAASAPVAKKKGGRKRKSSSGDESKSGSGASPEDGPPVKKTSHNVIEKRYRNNLNDKIQELRDSVPSLRAMSRPSGKEDDDSEDLEGLTPAHKLNKATVLAKATEYIKHLEKRNKSAMTEMAALKARLTSIEKSIAKSAALQSRQSLNPVDMSRSRQGSVASQILAAAGHQQQQQQQYMQQQHPQPTYDAQADPGEGAAAAYPNAHGGGGGGNGFMGKLMVGSLAGLMVMEGFHEQSQDGQSTSARGLFAAPTHLFRRAISPLGPSTGLGVGASAGAAAGSSSQAFFPMLKLFLVLAAFLYILQPMLSFRRPDVKKAAPTRLRLAAAPSLASPVEVRRKAWMTAVQSVWMPRHFLLEVVSVAVKMLKLSLRRIIGPDNYFLISGITKEDEAARVKAWDIAIDAQLAGGDAEVSYYRLLLTLMTSGTLPDSPIRLMQKAVHFRIFFWEVANAGYGNMFMFRDFTAKVARIYWDSARSQQHALAAGEYSEQQIIDDKIDMLPDHLASLIELGCDDVLTDEMIQRAYNLAWNRPSAENTIPNPTMDSVVEDHAIRSPLDAVAAWFTNMTIDGALTRSLDADGAVNDDVRYLVELANKTAPPASGTQTRALVVKAVFFDQDREANIASALDTLPTYPSTESSATVLYHSVPSNMVTHTPVSPDIHTALSMAKILSLASPSSRPAARVHAASALATLRLAPTNITLLTAIAAFKTLSIFSSDTVLFNSGKAGLDDVAGSLRLWIGTRSARSAGLSRDQKATVVESCLGVSRRVGGWKDEEERDSGYGSLEDGERDARVKA